MYYYLKGTLASKGVNYLVIDVGGVGYMVYAPLSDIEKAGAPGGNVTVYTYLNVREDAMELYGFITEEEKNMFLMLIAVSGCGPKAALAILSVASPSKLATAIITGDTKTLTKAQGVGPKVANRIILELKDKIDAQTLGVDQDGVIVSNEPEILDSRAEAMSALMALGYTAQEAKDAVAKLDAKLSTEDMLKKALASLA